MRIWKFDSYCFHCLGPLDPKPKTCSQLNIDKILIFFCFPWFSQQLNGVYFRFLMHFGTFKVTLLISKLHEMFLHKRKHRRASKFNKIVFGKLVITFVEEKKKLGEIKNAINLCHNPSKKLVAFRSKIFSSVSPVVPSLPSIHGHY